MQNHRFCIFALRAKIALGAGENALFFELLKVQMTSGQCSRFLKTGGGEANFRLFHCLPLQ